MLFEAMNWMDVEKYLERDDRVVLITGACEQHGYVSLLSDILAPVEIAQVACEIEDVLVAPRRLLGDGSYGGPYRASDEGMDLLFVAATDAMVAALRSLSQDR